MVTKGFKHKTVRRVILRDAKGKFVAGHERYTGKVKTVQVWRRRTRHWRLITVMADGNVTPSTLAQVLRRPEYESFPETLIHVADLKIDKRRKSKVMDAANQIDQMRGLKNKLLRITVTGRFKDRTRKRSFYMVMKRGVWAGYRLYARIHDAFSYGNIYGYDELAEIDEATDQFDLLGVRVDEVI